MTFGTVAPAARSIPAGAWALLVVLALASVVYAGARVAQPWSLELVDPGR